MKLRPDCSLTRFFEAVMRCRGSVRYVSDEGDDLDLRSELTRFFFAAICAQQIPNGSVIFEDTDDRSVLESFLEEER